MREGINYGKKINVAFVHYMLNYFRNIVRIASLQKREIKSRLPVGLKKKYLSLMSMIIIKSIPTFLFLGVLAA